MINNLAFLIDRGIIDRGTPEKPLTIEFPMGALGQAPPTVDNLALFVRTAREKLGAFRFAGCAMGRKTIAIQAATYDSHAVHASPAVPRNMNGTAQHLQHRLRTDSERACRPASPAVRPPTIG